MFAALTYVAAEIGVVCKRVRPLKAEERDDFGFVLSAALTLLALLIGFTFSMAVSRYDQRKNYEEDEANAIEYRVCKGRPIVCRKYDRDYANYWRKLSPISGYCFTQLEMHEVLRRSTRTQRIVENARGVVGAGWRLGGAGAGAGWRRTRGWWALAVCAAVDDVLELARVHGGCVEEPHTTGSVATDGWDRYVLQFSDRVRLASSQSAHISDFAHCRCHRSFPDL